jgi:hypothetical protein
MKIMLALALGVGLITAASAEIVRLANEPGGSIAGRVAKYQQLAARGVMVELSYLYIGMQHGHRDHPK